MCFNNNLKTAIHRYHIGTASLQKWTARVWFEKNHKFFSLPCLFLMCLITTWKQQQWQIWHRNSFFTKWTARVCFKINYEVSLLHEKTIFVQNRCLLIFTLTVQNFSIVCLFNIFFNEWTEEKEVQLSICFDWQKRLQKKILFCKKVSICKFFSKRKICKVI